jgi:coiled-coil domain-containing protein 55
MSILREAAAQRKLDRLRAEDIITAKQREKEGDEFADKESFVTPAYLELQEELRKSAEEEKKKEGESWDPRFSVCSSWTN